MLYVSPLKALSADIDKNLAEPRLAIRRLAAEAGVAPPRITTAVRTGDTSAAERAAMLKTPPHILVTTPESLYLLLTSERSRQMLRTVRTVIVDEIHAVIGTRRGAHLALSLERLQHVDGASVAAPGPVGHAEADRDGRAISRRAPRASHAQSSTRDTGVSSTSASKSRGRSLDAVMSHEVWEEYYDRLAALIEEHRTTLVFVNTRRMAERLARHLSDRLGEEAVTAHHGSLPEREAARRGDVGSRPAPCARSSPPRRWSSASTSGTSISSARLARRTGSRRCSSGSAARVTRLPGIPKGRLFPVVA